MILSNCQNYKSIQLYDEGARHVDHQPIPSLKKERNAINCQERNNRNV